MNIGRGKELYRDRDAWGRFCKGFSVNGRKGVDRY